MGSRVQILGQGFAVQKGPQQQLSKLQRSRTLNPKLSSFSDPPFPTTRPMTSGVWGLCVVACFVYLAWGFKVVGLASFGFKASFFGLGAWVCGSRLP